MFTFYDNLYGTSEKSWNLCWNEILGIFTTFYSWIPSDMVNIDNIPFSFDRDTVKAIGKLGISDFGNDFSDGITLTNNIIDDISDTTLEMSYLDKQGMEQFYEFKDLASITTNSGFIGFLNLKNRVLLDEKIPYYITYELLRDRQGNHKLFEIKNEEVEVIKVNTLFKGKINFFYGNIEI